MENVPETARMFGKALISLRVIALAGIATLIFVALHQGAPEIPEKAAAISPAAVDESLLYTFNVDGTLEETGSAESTRSPYWWLDSGGKLLIKDGVGKTVQGALLENDTWRKEYAKTNPADTEEGMHPQNLFRLLSRSIWDDVRMEASFWVIKDNLSKSPNRNESNGLLLMARYQDNGQTLYYGGIRVDGTAVIKKKYHGEYYTMAQEKIFSGSYDRTDMPDLLPSDGWLRIRMETVTNADGSVTVSLYRQDAGKWKKILSAKDEGQYKDTPPIKGASPVGIRTDFMDVQLDDILMEKI